MVLHVIVLSLAVLVYAVTFVARARCDAMCVCVLCVPLHCAVTSLFCSKTTKPLMEIILHQYNLERSKCVCE